MSHSILFVANDRVQIDILHAPENVIFDHRIFLCKFMNEFLDLCPLGTFLCAAAGCTVLGKTARALDKVKIISKNKGPVIYNS